MKRPASVHHHLAQVLERLISNIVCAYLVVDAEAAVPEHHQDDPNPFWNSFRILSTSHLANPCFLRVDMYDYDVT